MSTPSEKAADRMFADLQAMEADAERHMKAVQHEPGDAWNEWKYLWRCIRGAKAQALKCMSERDRKIAGG